MQNLIFLESKVEMLKAKPEIQEAILKALSSLKGISVVTVDDNSIEIGYVVRSEEVDTAISRFNDDSFKESFCCWCADDTHSAYNTVELTFDKEYPIVIAKYNYAFKAGERIFKKLNQPEDLTEIIKPITKPNIDKKFMEAEFTRLI